MHEVLAETGDPHIARAVADTLRVMTGHSAQVRDILERALKGNPRFDDLRRDLAFLIVADEPDAALALMSDIEEPVPIDAALRRRAALARHDTREAHDQFDDLRVSLGADDIGTAMELAGFHRARHEVAVAAQVMAGTNLPSRHPDMTRD
jgi:hypothetical protein